MFVCSGSLLWDVFNGQDSCSDASVDVRTEIPSMAAAAQRASRSCGIIGCESLLFRRFAAWARCRDSVWMRWDSCFVICG